MYIDINNHKMVTHSEFNITYIYNHERTQPNNIKRYLVISNQRLKEVFQRNA